jgi:DNA-binding transcriptional regulator YiaG
MKAFPKKCMRCRERAVSPIRLPSYETELEHDGRKYSVTLPDFDVLQCANCGEIYLDDAANERLIEALRSRVGLLSPREIRCRREQLELTQKAVANALQISESTLSRWETGAQMQQRCMDTFLRAFFDLEELRGYLGIQIRQGIGPL